jgi:hypothetical protein
MPIQSPEHRFWWEDEIENLENKLEATEIALKRANSKLWSLGLEPVKPEEKRAA